MWKMTNVEKKVKLDSIRNALSCESIPFEYNVQELVIKIKGIDMTDILLAVHDCYGEAITDLKRENAELKSRDCWKSCEYVYPKAELVGQHIKDVQKLTKAKEMIQEIITNKAVIKVYNPYTDDGTVKSLEIALNHWFQRAEQLIKEVE